MTTFPDFSLPGSDGRNHALADYQGRHLVVYFYPKDDTPGCTTEACSFRDLHSDFMRLDAAVLGVSADGLPSHQRFINKHGLPFVLLADSDHVLMDKLGVWQMKKQYGREFMGIVRSTFLVGPDGEIIREWRGVRVAGHVEEVLAAIALLKGGGTPAEPMEITAESAETPAPATPAPVVIPEAGGTGAAMQPLPMKAPTLAPEPVAPATPTPTPTPTLTDGAASAPVAPAPVAAPVVAPVAKTPTKKPSAPVKKAVAPVAKKSVAKKAVAKKPVAKKPAKPVKKVTKPAKSTTKAKAGKKPKAAKPAKAKSAKAKSVTKAKPAKAKAGKSKVKPMKTKPAKPAKSAKKAKATKKTAKKR